MLASMHSHCVELVLHVISCWGPQQKAKIYTFGIAKVSQHFGRASLYFFELVSF